MKFWPHILLKGNVYFDQTGLEWSCLHFWSYKWRMTKVICPSCYRLHDIENCTMTLQGTMISKKCNTRNFENSKCTETLLDAKLKPKYVYRYNSLKDCIVNMVKDPNFKTLINWRAGQERKKGQWVSWHIWRKRLERWRWLG